jgi:hypothetical protein
MRYRRRSLIYAGQPFTFDRIETRDSGKDRFLWAVSRQGEFIGTLTSPEEITTKEFDLRCARWLKELFGDSHAAR